MTLPASQALHTFLCSRRSIRQFDSRPVPAEIVARLLQTAECAPSAHNTRPWRFREIPAGAARQTLTQTLLTAMQSDLTEAGQPPQAIAQRAARTRRRIADAPLILLLSMDKAALPPQPTAHLTALEQHMGIQSTALAGLQLLLAAHAENLTAVWICWALYAPRALQTALNLPATWQPQALFFIGYPCPNPQSSPLLAA